MGIVVCVGGYTLQYHVETFDIWTHLCGQSYHYTPLIRCRMDFSGHLDMGALTHAVNLSLQTIPLVGCYFDAESSRPHWVERFSGEEMVTAVEAQTDAEEVVARCMSADRDCAAPAPSFHLTVVKKSSGDTLVAIISHIVCDGAGFKRYLYLLSELYTKLQAGETPLVPAFDARGTRPLFAGMDFREKMKIWRAGMGSYIAHNQSQLGVDFNVGENETFMEKRTLSREAFSALQAFSKARGATVNDGLMALFARAFCRNTGTNHILLPSTMDLRKFIPPGVTCGFSNYSSGCMCYISVEPDDSLSATLSSVSEQMRAYKSGNTILKSVLVWNLVARLIPYPCLKRIYSKIVKQPIISYSNLGILDADKLRFGALSPEDAYLTPAIKPRPYLQLNASTYDGRCTLSCNLYGSRADGEFACRLLDNMYQETAALVSSSLPSADQ